MLEPLKHTSVFSAVLLEFRQMAFDVERILLFCVYGLFNVFGTITEAIRQCRFVESNFLDWPPRSLDLTVCDFFLWSLK